MSLQEDVKEIVHRWKYTCTIPNEDFDEIINNILDAAVKAANKKHLSVQVVPNPYDNAINDVIAEINKLRDES